MAEKHLNIVERSATGNDQIRKLMPATVNPHLADAGCLPQSITPAAATSTVVSTTVAPTFSSAGKIV